MPFAAQALRPFTATNVQALGPNQFGVYGLFKQNVSIYVGKGDIRNRLLAHLNNDNPCISQQNPTHWVAELIAGDPSARERQLIAELRPTCNQRLG